MKKFLMTILTIFLTVVSLLNICGCKARPEIIFTDAKIKLEANNYMVTITKESSELTSEISPPFSIDFSYVIYKALIAKNDSGDKLLIIDFNTVKDAKKFYNYTNESLKADLAYYEAKSQFWKYYLDTCKDQMPLDTLKAEEYYYEKLIDTLKEKKSYSIGKNGTVVWYGTKNAIRDSKN